MPVLLHFYGKSKFTMTWYFFKNGTAETEMKHIKNISRGHPFEYYAIAQFNSITQCKRSRCGFFHFPIA